MDSQTRSASNATARQVIHELQHAASQYRIITTDEEIFERTGEQIVRACQLQMTATRWKQNLQLMVDEVRQWCQQRSDKLALGLLELRSDKVVFFFSPRAEQFDFELAREQRALEVELNTRGGIGYAETRQVPLWEIDRFVSPEALRIWPSDEHR